MGFFGQSGVWFTSVHVQFFWIILAIVGLFELYRLKRLYLLVLLLFRRCHLQQLALFHHKRWWWLDLLLLLLTDLNPRVKLEHTFRHKFLNFLFRHIIIQSFRQILPFLFIQHVVSRQLTCQLVVCVTDINNFLAFCRFNAVIVHAVKLKVWAVDQIWFLGCEFELVVLDCRLFEGSLRFGSSSKILVKCRNKLLLCPKCFVR